MFGAWRAYGQCSMLPGERAHNSVTLPGPLFAALTQFASVPFGIPICSAASSWTILAPAALLPRPRNPAGMSSSHVFAPSARHDQ